MNNALLLTPVDHSFPLRAGMSPTPYVARTPRLGFPRVSGDEPADKLGGLTIETFSLRERG